MFPLMRHSPVFWPVTLPVSRRTDRGDSAARQFHGATKSPRQSPRRDALADAFLGHIIPGVSLICEHPSLGHHPGVEVTAAEPAHRHCAPTIPIPFLAGNPPVGDPVTECASCAAATLPPRRPSKPSSARKPYFMAFPRLEDESLSAGFPAGADTGGFETRPYRASRLAGDGNARQLHQRQLRVGATGRSPLRPGAGEPYRFMARRIRRNGSGC